MSLSTQKILLRKAKAAKELVGPPKACNSVLRTTRSLMLPAELSIPSPFQLLENCTLGVLTSKASWVSATMKTEVDRLWSRIYLQASWKVDKQTLPGMVCQAQQRDRSPGKQETVLAGRRRESFLRHKQSKKEDSQEQEASSTQPRNQANQWI